MRDAAIDEDRLSETFAALANSTRRAILARLADGAATVNELAEPFDDDAAGDLEAHQGAGTRRAGRAGSTSPVPTVRPRRRATRGGLDLGRAVPAVWEARFDRMDDYLDATPTATETGDTMTDNNAPRTRW